MKYFIIILFISSFCYSQNGKISYKVESLKKEKKNKILAEGIDKEYPLMNFTLKYNKESSYFKQGNSIPVDPLKFKLASILIDSKESWFQNSVTKEAIINTKIKSKNYQVVYEKMKLNDWELKEDSKVIDGYICYKAERKQLNKRTGNYVSVIAWYTPDIPVPYGPIGEGGLPGLILQLQKGNFFVYTVNNIILNKKNMKIPLPKASEKIDVKTLIKLMRKARKVTVD